MADDDWDRRVRLHAFAFLEQLTMRWETELPWSELSRGFDVDGRRVTLLGARGIWKPAIKIPRRPNDRPDPDRLGERYELFRAAS